MPRNLRKYQSTDYMRRAYEAKQRQRAEAHAGTWVIGRFIVMATDTLGFEGIAEHPGHYIDPEASLTTRLQDVARWRNRQAAHQWLKFNPQPRHLRPVNLEQLVAGRKPAGSRRPIVNTPAC